MRRKLSDIIISAAFANTIPREEKMNKCRENWKNFHRQDRYIVVNTDGVLIDGYIQYLVLMVLKDGMLRKGSRNEQNNNI